MCLSTQVQSSPVGQAVLADRNSEIYRLSGLNPWIFCTPCEEVVLDPGHFGGAGVYLQVLFLHTLRPKSAPVCSLDLWSLLVLSTSCCSKLLAPIAAHRFCPWEAFWQARDVLEFDARTWSMGFNFKEFCIQAANGRGQMERTRELSFFWWPLAGFVS